MIVSKFKLTIQIAIKLMHNNNNNNIVNEFLAKPNYVIHQSFNSRGKDLIQK